MSTDWIQQHRLLHQDSPRNFAGKSVRKWIDAINQFADLHHCETILDYGCGKAQFWPPEWQGRVSGYDPAVDQFSQEPQPADLVICVDVMEHIPHNQVTEVIDRVNSLARRALFWVVDVKPAKKRFLNGVNCHLTQQPAEWWRDRVHQDRVPYQINFESQR